MTLYVLVIILFTAGGPKPLFGITPDRDMCETTYSQILTDAMKDDAITGWSVPNPCTETTEGAKT